jgi:hypothetical protein
MADPGVVMMSADPSLPVRIVLPTASSCPFLSGANELEPGGANSTVPWTDSTSGEGFQ